MKPTRAEVEALITDAPQKWSPAHYIEWTKHAVAMLRALIAEPAVPREPTREMLEAADPINNFELMNLNVWRAMYDAAPKAAPDYLDPRKAGWQAPVGSDGKTALGYGAPTVPSGDPLADLCSRQADRIAALNVEVARYIKEDGIKANVNSELVAEIARLKNALNFIATYCGAMGMTAQDEITGLQNIARDALAAQAGERKT